MRNDGLSSCPSTLRPMIATYRNKEIPRKAALIGAGGVLAGELRMGRAGLNHCAETLTVAFGPTWRNLGTLECKLDFTYATWSCVVGATEAEVKPSQKIKNGGKKAGFQLLALSLKLARSPSYPQRGPTWAQVDAMLCTCRSKSGPTWRNLVPFGGSFAPSWAPRRQNIGNIASCAASSTPKKPYRGTQVQMPLLAFFDDFVSHGPCSPCWPMRDVISTEAPPKQVHMWCQIAACGAQVGTKLGSSSLKLTQVQPMLQTCWVEIPSKMPPTVPLNCVSFDSVGS